MINQNDNLMSEKDAKDKTNPRQKSLKELVIAAEMTEEGPKDCGESVCLLKEG